MSAALESLAALPGVAGLCHYRGGEVVWSRLPDDVSPERASALCHAVSSAFAVYAGAGRMLREAWFEFPAFAVLVTAPPSPGSGSLLTFFISDRSAGAAVAAAAKAAPLENS